MQVHIAVILVLVQIALANINSSTTNLTINGNLVDTKKVSNGTDKPEVISLQTDLNNLNTNNTRRNKACVKKAKKKVYKTRSTSSSSGEKELEKSDAENKESLYLSGSSVDSERDATKYLPPFPNATGWRQWHRQCTPCPEDMAKKWRDPSISWICGGYQRARRSFKSECMMYYRNCQDGTMFTKIHDHRCSNTFAGKHFFYDYKVKLSMDSDSKSSEDTPETDSDESDSDLLFRRDTHNSKGIVRQSETQSAKTSKHTDKKAKRSEEKVTKNEIKS